MTDQLDDAATCSFCGRGPGEVKRLIAGPGVWICDGCIRVCHAIIEDVDGTSPTAPDPVLAEIAAAQQLALSGARTEAERLFTDLWKRLGPDPVHRATLAHYMADLQDDPALALDWDLRALAAADTAPDAGVVRGLYASLQVNVADGYMKTGDQYAAREHLEKARGSARAPAVGRLRRAGPDGDRGTAGRDRHLTVGRDGHFCRTLALQCVI